MPIQANQELLRNNSGVSLQSLLQAHRRLQLCRAVKRIAGGIDRLQCNEDRHRIRRHRRHRDRFRDPGEVATGNSLLQVGKLLRFLRARLAKNARAEIAGHERPRLGHQGGAEALAESAHTNEGGNSNCDREYDEGKLARRRLEVAPADGCRAMPIECAFSHFPARSG